MDNAKNSVRLAGFTGIDPVIVNYAGSKKMGRISLAVNEAYKNTSGEFVNKTQWFNLVFWNKKVELIEAAVKKGTEISIEGKLNNQSYTDKKGEQRFSTEIIVNAIEIIR
jgi:single-strand DNA-binding protein